MSRPHALLLPYLLSGCGGLQSDDGSFVLDESIEALSIEVETGSVEVVASDDQARVDWERTWNAGCPDIEVQVSGGVLQVVGDCSGLGWGCRTDFRIQVPAGIPVQADLVTGDLFLEQVGAVDAALTTGDLRLDGAQGALDLDVVTGSVQGRDLDAAAARVEVTTGDIELELEGELDDLRAEITTGSLWLQVPAGSYDLDLDVVTGDIELQGVSSDEQADASITARVTTGDIELEGE